MLCFSLGSNAIPMGLLSPMLLCSACLDTAELTAFFWRGDRNDVNFPCARCLATLAMLDGF